MEVSKSGVLYEYEDGTFEFVDGVEVSRTGTPFEGRETRFQPETMQRIKDYLEQTNSRKDSSAV